MPGLSYGYEEALGYCVDPQAVRDKDGVSAALLVAELAAAGSRRAGARLLDELDDIARRDRRPPDRAALGAGGRPVADLRRDGAAARASRPPSLAGSAVDRADDLAAGVGDLPPTDGLRYYLADGSRVIVRPSGTEPKLKAYLEVVEPVPDDRRARPPARSRRSGSRRCAPRSPRRSGCEPAAASRSTVADEEQALAAPGRARAADDFMFLLDATPGQPWAGVRRAAGGDPARRGPARRAGCLRRFLVAEVDGEIVGRVSVRHELNGWLDRATAAHIGYGVRPQFRRRGYATEILRQALQVARDAGVERRAGHLRPRQRGLGRHRSSAAAGCSRASSPRARAPPPSAATGSTWR